MKQKFSITVADIKMNIICEESQEIVDTVVSELDKQIRSLTAASGNSCTRTEAALLSALDYSARCMRLQQRVNELENYINSTDPTGDTYEANLLRGENEALRARLQVGRGEYDALLQDNATLFQLNAKLMRQNGEANARADRMHDQVLSILSEVRELREKLAAMCVDTRAPSPSYTANDPEPAIEITPTEQQVTHKYEQMDLNDVLASMPRVAPRPVSANPLIDDTEGDEDALSLSEMLDFDGQDA